MRSLYLSFSLLLVTFTAAGQQHLQNANWYYAQNMGINFLPTVYNPASIPGCQIYGQESCGSVSDQQGNLLFYTDGVTVWNSNDQVMTNGTGLLGDSSNTQLVIIPKPKYPNRYYIITIGGESGGHTGLHYTEVDMSNGLGEVVASQKNIVFNDHNDNPIDPAYGNNSEKITSTVHSNGVDYWMVAQVNKYIYSYIITDAGPNTTPSSTTLSLADIMAIPTLGVGQMKISPDTQHIGIVYKDLGVYSGEFDNTTGLVTLNPNPIVAPNNAIPYYGLEFSPLSQYMYFTTNQKLYGVNLANNTIEYIEEISSDINVSKGLQLALNGQIYVAMGATSFSGSISPSVIKTPDDITNPNYDPNVILLLPNARGTMSLPQWVHWQLFECQPNITLSIPETNFQPFTYGYLDYIITNNKYMVTEWQNISMIAGDYILLQPNTSILSGSVFLAQIDNCVESNQASAQQRSMNTGVLEKEGHTSQFTVYPNPTSGQLTVTFDSKVSSFSIIDVTGKELMKINNNNPNEIILDLSGLASGIYFLSADGKPIQKIIKN